MNVVLLVHLSIQVPSHPDTVYGNPALPVSIDRGPTEVDQLSFLPAADHQDPPPTEEASQS